MKKYAVMSLVFLLTLVFFGCTGNKPVEPLATISGYVTDSRGGSVLSGVRVYGQGFSVLTNDEGYFELKVKASSKHDLFAEKEGFGRALVPDVFLKEDEELELVIPIRETFNPDWSMVPPRVRVEGVARDDLLSGEVDIKVTIEGENDAFLFYVYFCGMQRGPAEFWDIDTDEGEGTIDTRLYPNGKGYLRILAYDVNENLTIVIVPVIIENEVTAGELPADLTTLNISSTTYSAGAGFYNLEQKAIIDYLNLKGDLNCPVLEKEMNMEPQVVPADTTVYNLVGWNPVEGAVGYNVYGSYDDEEYKLLGCVITPHKDDYGNIFWQYDDFSPLITPGSPSYYEVRPYNSLGESAGLRRSIIPIVPFQVRLLEPHNGATNVPLRPTFTWETLYPVGPMNEGAIMFYGNWLFEGTGGDILVDITEGAEEFTLGFSLQPGTVYTWDVASAWAYTYDEFADGYSYAMGYAGVDTGSLNGEFIFTTTLALD